ncbi:alpha/beta hydrolase [Anaeromyxobacter dehalogenans]|uniref:Alpha/beta hydrolase fold-1 n=1 Tax=Anaeromyxobacter dehalogenans (strain 2CP-C) TaxID=290397 RepID=Q2IF65_ANADE|nr:alpha/beta fold hydrolase [Anaeromyxobacter dehalogenans]ABC83225.1 Alpha/beta hydrolase fold-1 [Anaeromyxobacter dehalogenans 2CP-C]
MVRTSSARGDEFDLPGGPDAVLLLHGLTGSTFEVLPVAERLHAAGMRCLAPRMAGHAGGPEALGAVSYTEWIAQARRDLERLAGARRTFLVGCSMGALVACALAHDHPARADGLVLLAPALELQLQGRLGALLGRLGPLRRVVIPKAAGSDVRDPEMRAANPAFPGVPLGAVAELAKLARHVDAQLPGIAAPALVIAGGHDHTVTLGGARRLARRIGSGPAALRVLPESWHLVGIDVERERCAEAAARFLEALPVPGGRRRADRPAPARRRKAGATAPKAKGGAGRRRRR